MQSGPIQAIPEDGVVLRIYMLGGFRLLRGSRDLEPRRWELQKAVAVFKYLVCEEGRWVPTDLLLELFWPDTDPERAKGALRTTVYALRRSLEPELKPYSPSSYIDAVRGRYRFRTESVHWWDVKAFQQLVESARQTRAHGRPEEAAALYEQALSLYAGDLLPEDRYEEWTVLLREQLRNKYLESVLELADLLRGRPGGVQRALGYLREAVSRAPEREDLQRELIWHLAAAGNVPEALRQYEALRQLLDEEFGVEPAPETQELLRQIKQGGLLRDAPQATQNLLPLPARGEAAAGRRESDARGGDSSGNEGPRRAGVQRAVLPSPGALVTDWPTFRRMVQLERRRMLRWSMPVTVVLLELETPLASQAVDPGRSWEQMEAFFQAQFQEQLDGADSQPPAAWQQQVATHLRQGDVVCPVGDRWLLVLLPQADEAAAHRVAERLARFAADSSHPQGRPPAASLEFRLVPLQPAA